MTAASIAVQKLAYSWYADSSTTAATAVRRQKHYYYCNSSALLPAYEATQAQNITPTDRK
jgi:hypothetical protein